ncbi:hypothetical protein F5Y13DRAFT_204421 [Hypoxylon sp. FL1857]|nr:hypothetical protein F5Y13DRAFT_204421 [Hypoxylon sp. FL1857]
MALEPLELPGLPLEIFLLVCSHLSPTEARSLRLCCKHLAYIGACHLFREIVVHLYKPSLANLRALADHPIISKNIKTLFYEAGSLVFNNGDPYDDLVHPEDSFSPSDYWDYWCTTEISRDRQRVYDSKNNWLPSGAFEHDPITYGDLKENYGQYVDAVRNQAQISWDGEDFSLFEEVIPKLEGLKEIIVNHGRPDHPSPYDCFFKQPGSQVNSRQLQAVLFGLSGTEIQLHSLCAMRLSSNIINAPFFNQMAISCKELKAISLDFRTRVNWVDEFYIPTYPLCIQDTRRMVDTGVIRLFLTQLSNLERLSLGFDPESPRWLLVNEMYPASLRSLVPPTFLWKNLREVQLSYVETQRQELFNFFERHRSTLKVVRLNHCKLTTTSWIKLLWQMKGALDLGDICISGRLLGQFESEEDHTGFEYDPHTPVRQDWWLGVPKTTTQDSSLTDDITAWFLHDAPFPLVPGVQRRHQHPSLYLPDDESP